MGLIIVSILVTIIATWYILHAVRYFHNTTSFFLKLSTIAIFFYALLLSIGYLIAETSSELATIFVRTSGALAFCTFIFLLRIVIFFPYQKRWPLLNFIVLAGSAFLIWRIIGTADYVESVRRVQFEFIRFNGPMHSVYALTGVGIGVACIIISIVRALTISSKIYRQQLLLIAAGYILHTIFGYIFAIYLPEHGFAYLYPVSTIPSFLSIASIAFAMNATRLFHLPTAIKSITTRLLILLLFGIPAGFIVASAYLLRLESPWVSLGVSIFIFLPGFKLANSFYEKYFVTIQSESTREALEAAIAHINLASGRDAVLNELLSILQNSFNCSSIQILVETEQGRIEQAWPETNRPIILERTDPLIEILSNIKEKVILKTDIISSPAFHAYKDSLLELFEKLSAEALVISKEGQRIIGIFIFGAKLSGADYNANDYLALNAIQGKLFVIAYYARHVEREALLVTVQKQIGLADQIIHSVQEHIDPIIYPGIDTAYKTYSTRKLGGDLFDSVKISESRWFFILGDIAGKGLNAAMSMVILKAMIRNLLHEESDFLQLVAKLNDFIKDHLPRGTFFAGVLGFLALDKRSVYFINCGIPAMMLRSPSFDTVIEVQGEGRMLGIVRNILPYLKPKKLPLPHGSTLVITTDGILEAANIRGEQYGKERLARIINENKNRPASDIIEAVLDSANAFTDKRLDDDITILAINFYDTRSSQ